MKRIRWIRWAVPGIAALLVATARDGIAQRPRRLAPVLPGNLPAAPAASMLSAEADFRVVDGRVLGPWRRSAKPLIAYFTGPDAQRHPGFTEVGEKVAARVRGRFQEIHKEDLLPSAADENGALLYPDGAARVMLLIMPGGNSAYVMADLAGISDPRSPEAMVRERAKFEEARKLPQAAFRGGMNYVGCCGGFFTAGSDFDIPRAVNKAWGLWPGKVANIGPGQRRPFPDVVFEGSDPRHPLVKAAKGGVLKGMYYNGGPIGVRDGVPDTEYFGKYRGGNMPELEGDWFLVAYRAADNPFGGRCVIATGHPEVNHRDYLLEMALYAVDHEIETLVRPIEFDRPVVGLIGDEQLHYYRLEAPAAGRLTLELTGLAENCDVYLRAGLPPTPARYDAKSEAPGTGNERIIHSTPRGGPWYVAVYGRHGALNGARYALVAKWN